MDEIVLSSVLMWVVGLKELMNVLHEVCEAGDWV